MMSAAKGGTLTEVDSDGNGVINNSDANNTDLATDLTTANSLCSRYIDGRWTFNSEKSPWDAAKSLWSLGSTATRGVIGCYHADNGRQIVLTAWDNATTPGQLYRKTISAD